MMGINAVNTKEGYVEIFLTVSLTWNDPCFFFLLFFKLILKKDL